MVWIRGTISVESRTLLNRTRDNIGASNRRSPVDDSENALGCTPNSHDSLRESQLHHKMQLFRPGRSLLPVVCGREREMHGQRNGMWLRNEEIELFGAA